MIFLLENIEHPTPNTELPTPRRAEPGWVLEVGCWAFDVFLLFGCGFAVSGRRRIVVSRSAKPVVFELRKGEHCCSLSLRERVRVRGNKPQCLKAV